MIERYDGKMKAFASEYTCNYKTIFNMGVDSSTLESNMTDDWFRGFESVDKPTIQDWNAFGYTITTQINYLYQQGISEWNSEQDYYIDSLCVYNGTIYLSTTGSLSSPNVGNTPDGDDIWLALSSSTREPIKNLIKDDSCHIGAGTFVWADTSNGSWTLQLDDANNFEVVKIVDFTGSFDTNNLIVDGGVNTIMGSDDSFVIDVENASVELRLINGDWRVV